MTTLTASWRTTRPSARPRSTPATATASPSPRRGSTPTTAACTRRWSAKSSSRGSDAGGGEGRELRRAVGSALRPRPLADRAYVDVDEVRLRVEADAAGPQAQGGAVQRRQPDALDADVGGLAEQVLAVGGDLAALGAEHAIGGGRTIAADQLHRPVHLQPRLDGV